MAQSSGQSSGLGPDIHLPDEILKVIPTDPYDQLDLARKITSMAIASRVSKMDIEMTRMRQASYDKDKMIFELEEKVMGLNRAHQDAESRLKNALEENARLSKERDQLAMTAKKLSRDLAKLETFKRQLMQSLSDDNSSTTETVDIATCEQTIPKSYANKDDGADHYSAYRSFNGSNDVGNSKGNEDSRLAGHKFSLTPYITPRLTPTGTPSLTSTAGSPKAYSAIPTPQKSSGAASPTNLSYDGRGSYSSCKIHCPFICFCKPSSHIFTPGPLKLESSPQVPSKLLTVPEVSDDQLPAQTSEVKQDKSDVQQPDGNCVKSSLRNSNSESGIVSGKQQKKVQWMDAVGKELVEIREFYSSEAEDTEFRRKQNRSCVCVIL